MNESEKLLLEQALDENLDKKEIQEIAAEFINLTGLKVNPKKVIQAVNKWR